jgi:transposase
MPFGVPLFGALQTTRPGASFPNSRNRGPVEVREVSRFKPLRAEERDAIFGAPFGVPFPQMLAQNPQGWGNAPPAPPPPQITHRGAMLPFVETSDGEMSLGWPQIALQAGDAFQRFTNAAEAALGGRHAPIDTNPRPGDEILASLAATGGLAAARPMGSLGAFGRLPMAEELATPGKYANPRKANDWGGAYRLGQARTAARKGMSPEDVWEKYGWARQGEPGSPTFNREAAERYGIEPGQWYMEYGTTPRSLGERFELGIGQRKQTPPWRTEAPETAFDAPTVADPPAFMPEDAARPPPRAAAPYEAGRAVSAPADKLTASIRAFEDKLRGEGKSNAEIAAAVSRRFMQKVTPAEIASGSVWWRMREITGRETGRGERGRFMPAREMLTPEALAALQSPAFRDLSNEQAAKALRDRFGLSFIRQTITKVRRQLGLDADVAKPTPLPPEAEAALRSPEMRSLTNRQAADMLRQRFGLELSENAVRQRRIRRGVKSEHQRGRAGLDPPPEVLQALRSEKYRRMGKRTAAEELKREFGYEISPQSVWNLRLKLGL